MLHRFQLEQLHTTARREVLAGLTTFLGMSYIVFVNPAILADAGIDRGAAFVATCLAAALGSAIMGGLANYPIALAPGMGLNAYFAYTVVGQLGYSWQVGLGAVFVSGCLFLLLSALKVRTWLMGSIPQPLKLAISAGIGLFLGIIGLKNAGIVVDSPATLVTLGDLSAPATVLASLGFVLMLAMAARGILGAILLAIVAVSAVGVPLGLTEVHGVVAMPPSLTPTWGQLDIAGALQGGGMAIVFTFLFVDLFDTAGTLVGVAHRAELLDEEGHLPRSTQAFVADSAATIAGAVLGTSTTTSYIESTLGVEAGGRSGLTALTVAGCFGLCLFLSPLAETIPAWATAPALVYVACLMTKALADLNWDDVTDYGPAVLCALAMPLTFSIATGIGMGFVSYVAAKALAGRWAQLNVSVTAIAGLFVLRWSWFHGG